MKMLKEAAKDENLHEDEDSGFGTLMIH